MAKLNFILADTDKAYIEALVSFMTENYSSRFNLRYFTDQRHLLDYLNDGNCLIDIMLASPEMIPSKLPKEKSKCTLILSQDRLVLNFMEYPAVYKFQNANLLIDSTLGIYAEKNEEAYIQGGNRNTQVIGVYSPAGGSGKTSVALACAIKAVESRHSIFYLNLEDIQSTLFFLESKTEKNLSHAFFYLKENAANIALKIESIRQIDEETGIHFFAPPESILEYDEITPENFKSLIWQLRYLSLYDIVFVDMSSSFNEKNAAVLESCDKIILVLAQDAVTGFKAEKLLKEIDTAYRKFGTDFREKLIFVLNKYNPEVISDIENIEWIDHKSLARIPNIDSLAASADIKNSLNMSSGFKEGVSRLLQKIIKEEKIYE